MTKATNTKKIIITVAVIAGIIAFGWLLQWLARGSYTPTGTIADPILGGTNASVVIVEYGDFQCPACKKMEPLIKRALQEFGDQISLQFNDFPLVQVHPNAYAASEAAQCAFTQNKFWEYHDRLYDQQEAWTIERDPAATFRSYAKDLGLDQTAFQQCLDTHASKAGIDEDMHEGNAQHINSTPTLFINGERYVGSGAYDSLRQAIERHLADNANSNVTNTTINSNTTNLAE